MFTNKRRLSIASYVVGVALAAGTGCTETVLDEPEVATTEQALGNCVLDVLSFDWSLVDCSGWYGGPQVTYWGALNGTYPVFGVGGGSPYCLYDCEPGSWGVHVPGFYIDSYWDSDGPNHVAMYPSSPMNDAFTWMKATATLADGRSETKCLYDVSGSNCTSTNVCAGYCSDFTTPCPTPFEATFDICDD